MRFEKFKWERVGESYDLKLLNPEITSPGVLEKLFAIAEGIESCGKHLHRDSSNEFNRWFQNMDTPLKEQAYARLSNWFLCDMPFIPKSDLGLASRYFWDTLFCSKPEKRLTDPKKDHKVLPERFDLWWPNQQKCQKDC